MDCISFPLPWSNTFSSVTKPFSPRPQLGPTPASHVCHVSSFLLLPPTGVSQHRWGVSGKFNVPSSSLQGLMLQKSRRQQRSCPSSTIQREVSRSFLFWEVDYCVSPGLTSLPPISAFHFPHSSATLHVVDVMLIWTRISWSEDIAHKVHCGAFLELSITDVCFKKLAFYFFNGPRVTGWRQDPQNKFEHF